MSKNFEQKVNKAKEVLDKLVSKEVSLEEALKLYKDGIKYLGEAQEMIDKAKLEFDNLVKDDDKAR